MHSTSTIFPRLTIFPRFPTNSVRARAPFAVPVDEASFCPAVSVFTCTHTITITQGDMDVGGLSGNVTITAVTPEGEEITATIGSDVSVDGSSSVVLGR